jgi:serine/threonine protein kinase
MPGGTLGNAIERELSNDRIEGWSPTKKSICIFGIAAAMRYLHSKEIVHRDLKLENIMLNGDLEPVICDFGLARVLELGLAKTFNIGSPLYMAPELFGDFGTPGKEIDVYAYGVLLYRMFSNNKKLDDAPDKIWNTPQQFLFRIGNGARLMKVEEIPAFYWGLIENCWKTNPSDRPKFDDIVKMFKEHRDDYAIPGTNLHELVQYELKVTRGVTRSSDGPKPVKPYVWDQK